MKIIDREPEKDNKKSEATKDKHDTDDYNNEITAGAIGLEGGGNNGAPELRYLHKKYGTVSDNKKK